MYVSVVTDEMAQAQQAGHVPRSLSALKANHLITNADQASEKYFYVKKRLKRNVT